MKKIIRSWELHDFCYTHGRVIPHLKGNSTKFTTFHCADKRHDDSETIICSEGIGECDATFACILSMSGYVVKFACQDEYLLCTKEEFEKLQQESALVELEEKREKEELELQKPENPARPRGLKITRSDMVIEYKSYERCTEYPQKMSEARNGGYLTPPFIFGDYSYKSLLCTDDCIFCHCPFYAQNLLDELRHNHRDDYDEWVLSFFEKFQ